MLIRRLALAAVMVFVPFLTHASTGIESESTEVRHATDDENLWLEDIGGKTSLDWVRARNAETTAHYATGAAFDALVSDLRSVLDSNANVPRLMRLGDYYYNLGKDKDHPHGVWRRTTLAGLRAPATAWETVIDLDALSASEHDNWLWRDAQCLPPTYQRCLIALSRAGAYAQVVREFDLTTRTFVSDGFNLPEAKGTVSWIDADHIFVATDFGPGSISRSGYPRMVKVWTRGTPLSAASTILESTGNDLGVDAHHDASPGFERDIVTKNLSFYESETYLRGKDGRLARIDVPRDANVDVKREWLLIQLRSQWSVGGRSYPAGSLLAAHVDDYMAGNRDIVTLFRPDPHTSLTAFAWTRNHLLLTTMHDVATSIVALTPRARGPWPAAPLAGLPALNSLRLVTVDSYASDEYLVYAQGFLQPSTLYRGTVGKDDRELLRQGPAAFDASGFEVSQHFAVSKDGTRVPYFEVAAKGLRADGSHPTLIWAYGGFELAVQPNYSPALGKAWLERGGVYVVANVRGGGEYGPLWHEAAMKANRPRSYEDVAAVARDLVARRLTTPAHLGVEGESNGGLLAGNMLVGYPELFGAVIVGAPLLDMRRYTHLAAGSSWVGEFGDPDKPEEWTFLRTFSPYQNLRAGTRYPPALFMTATTDDTVGPAHARKMVARMRAMGLDASLYENVEGGHGGSSNNAQVAYHDALIYTFLWEHLK